MKKHNLKKANIILLICCLIEVCILFVYAANNDLKEKQSRHFIKETEIKNKVEAINPPICAIEVTAHRGNLGIAPENTLIAIKYAIKENFKYAEIDIQETKDFKLVVFHDDTLSRVSGISKSISDFTLKELSEIDAGSWFEKKYSFARIPTLEEVLILSKDKIKLNIEIKNDKYHHIAKKAVELIEKYEFENECIITASSYKILDAVKSENSQIKTGRICTRAEQILIDSPVTDIFSLSSALITQELVSKIHQKGKSVHVWTVNTQEMTRKMISFKVDNIISDNPKLVRKIIEE